MLVVAVLAVALDFELAAADDHLGRVVAVPVAVAAVVAVVRPVAVDFVLVVCLDLVARVVAVVAVRPVAVDFGLADCLDLVCVVAVVAVQPVAVDFDPAGRAVLCSGLVACLAVVAVVRTVGPAAVALYLYLDGLVAARKSQHRHSERTTQPYS